MKAHIILLSTCILFVSGGKNQFHEERTIERETGFLTSSNDILFSCSYTSAISDDDCIPDNFGTFSQQNISVAIVLKKVLGALLEDSTTIITANFLPYECHYTEPVFKALSKKSDSTRYILYTQKQLDLLVSTNTNWIAYSIFSHEIGHHLYGHSLSNPKSMEESRARELQADFFSGYVLHKLKSSLADAQSGINAFNNHPTEELEQWCTHPIKTKRLDAVKRGYEYESVPQATTRQLLQMDSLKKRIGFEQIFNKTLDLILNKNYEKALGSLDELKTALGGKYISDFYNNSGFIKSQSGDLNGAIKDYDKAIAMKTDEADYFFNRAAAKKLSDRKELKAESKEDIKVGIQLKKIEQAKVSNF